MPSDEADDDMITTEEQMVWEALNSRLVWEVVALKTGLPVREVTQVISDITPRNVSA